MTVNECFALGHIIKPHGLKGEVDAFLDTDRPEQYRKLESVFVERSQKLVPLVIRSIQIKDNKARILFEGIESIDDSGELKGALLYLPLSILSPLKGNRFYFHEIVGFEVFSDKEGLIGKVSYVHQYPGQNVMVIEQKGHEVLVPVNDKIVQTVDRDLKQLRVELPDGLLDIYTAD